MYGVVLWSDQVERKAVIWCEDHGDLAYYNAAEHSVFDGASLDAGDLVHFQLDEGSVMRRAQNPELVSEGHAPAIADRLRGAVSRPAERPKRKTANVLAFPVREVALA